MLNVADIGVAEGSPRRADFEWRDGTPDSVRPAGLERYWTTESVLHTSIFRVCCFPSNVGLQHDLILLQRTLMPY
jgi:hypothetical protein